MPSTEFSILLPGPPTRPALRAFWGTLVVGATLCAFALLWLGGSPGPVRSGIVLTLGGLAFLFGMVFPYEIAIPYRAWNRSVRRLAPLASRYVTEVCLRTVVAASPREGSNDLFEPGEASSMWLPRGTLSANDYASPGGGEASGRSRSFRRGRALLPFATLIRVLDTGERQTEPSHTTYALF